MFSRKLGSAQQRPSFWTCKPHHKLLNLEAMEWKLCRKICLQNLSTLELVPGYWWILQDWTDFLVYDTWSNCSSLPTHLGRLKAAISKGFTVQALSLPPFRQASSHERVLQGLKKPNKFWQCWLWGYLTLFLTSSISAYSVIILLWDVVSTCELSWDSGAPDTISLLSYAVQRLCRWILVPGQHRIMQITITSNESYCKLL